jgi:glucosamine 6-phosphate synthetase-like amidotransferase/phosphosugar isomerase protein
VTRADHVLRVLPKLELLSPILFAIPPQLLAYRTAGLRHCDVDRPME